MVYAVSVALDAAGRLSMKAGRVFSMTKDKALARSCTPGAFFSGFENSTGFSRT